MNYFENEFALPIILGNSKESIQVAKLLQKKTELEIHIIAKKLSLLNMLRFYFHKLCSDSDEIILMIAEDILKDSEEYYTPVLIYDKNEYGELIKRNAERVETSFIIMSVYDFKKHFTKEEKNENQ